MEDMDAQVRIMRTRVDLGLPAGSPTDWRLALVCKIQEELDWEED